MNQEIICSIITTLVFVLAVPSILFGNLINDVS